MLSRFILLYATLYAAFGVASPFLPLYGSERGLTASQIGLVFAAAAAVRTLVPLLAGRVGDLTRSLRVVLSLCAALAALAMLGFLGADTAWTFLAVSLLYAASLGPVGMLADALALGSARPPGARGPGG